MNRSYKIPIAIAIGGIIVAGAMFVSTPNVFTNQDGNLGLVRPVTADDHILGNPVAPATIVVYCDFDSTFCKDMTETLQQIVANGGARGEVALVFRQFPLTELHPNALLHARAVECIAKTAGNEVFWKFVTILFRNQPIDPKRYGTFASTIDISGNEFANCYADAAKTVDTRIEADRQNALDIGANGVPYSVILVTGKPPVVMAGAYPYNTIQQLVDQTLGN